MVEDSTDFVDPSGRRMEIMVKDSLSSAVPNCSTLFPSPLLVGPGEVDLKLHCSVPISTSWKLFWTPVTFICNECDQEFFLHFLVVLLSTLMNWSGICFTGWMGDSYVQHLVPCFPTSLGHRAIHLAQHQNTGLMCKFSHTHKTNKQS